MLAGWKLGDADKTLAFLARRRADGADAAANAQTSLTARGLAVSGVLRAFARTRRA